MYILDDIKLQLDEVNDDIKRLDDQVRIVCTGCSVYNLYMSSVMWILNNICLLVNSMSLTLRFTSLCD